MPFTPFHMGPGLLIKSVLRGAFSLMVFGWAQIIMDIQPLLVMLTGDGHLHGFSHTYLGASLLAVLAAVTGKPLAAIGLKILRVTPERKTITWPIAFVSAAIGSYSHVFLDSIMHADVQPWFPFRMGNPLLGLLSYDAIHWFCLGTALLGIALYVLVSFWRDRNP
ncbi:hypothetical protein QWI17_21820 [Gilvimarinus sp. SDUM040013]|uniref:Hydrolase n=1 Tax=Gilvimarinus gilvus TaxID=3058038 RepID=A0ABU4RYA4_9GAMM|nr:metal-dependent hydrolase [Gilvimarinus sp. SDUM040013]MDO3388500.1 hypothetical protein [Gilvimarinus sp. SDUM040013]MDX6848628.1 hypothetical protein [Gilvimarinus sp. SDUM040013]